MAQGTPPPLDVAVLVLDACNTLTFAAAVDPMRAANRLARRRLFNWDYVTPKGAPVALTSGLSVPGRSIDRLQNCDLLIVLAGFHLERQSTPALCASIRRIAASGAMLAGIDGGPWILAAAGVLDGYRATTHWEDLDRFAEQFPEVTTLPDRYHVDRTRLTSGGAAPAIEMMLHLIRTRYGDTLAARVAGVFIHDTSGESSRVQQRMPVLAASPGAHSRLTRRAHEIMTRTLASPLAISEIAAMCETSARTLQLRFRQHLSTTAQNHYLALRLQEAQRLLSDSDVPVTEVAFACGFNSHSAFSRAFRKAFGQSPRALRAGST